MKIKFITTLTLFLIVVSVNNGVASSVISDGYDIRSDDDYYLYVMFHDNNTSGERFRIKTTSKQECLELIHSAKLIISNTRQSDDPVMAAMWCGTADFQRNYNSNWWKDNIKDRN